MSKRLSLLGLLALTSSLSVATAADRPEALWPERQILFWAEWNTGAVHVVGLRAGLSEYGVLRAPTRHDVLRLSFDARSHRLTVEASNGDYVYDGWSLKLVAHHPTALAAERFRYARP